MQNAIIDKWGFEHPNTIHFFTICEKYEGDKFVIDCAFAADLAG